jgi:copper chaperone CopZ
MTDAAITYVVRGMSCEHCERAVTQELTAVPNVAAVEADLAGKLVTVRGSGLDDAVLRRAIADAGYDAEPSG